MTFNRAARDFHGEDLGKPEVDFMQEIQSVKSWPQRFGLLELNGNQMRDEDVPLRKTLDTGQPIVNREMLIQRKDGTRIRIAASTAQIKKDGQVIGAVATMRNITHVFAIEQRFAQLLANVPGMAFRRRKERPWIVEIVSEGCAELTGYDRNQVQGETAQVKWDQIVNRDDIERYARETLNLEKPYTVVYRIQRREGVIRWVLERGAATRYCPVRCAHLL